MNQLTLSPPALNHKQVVSTWNAIGGSQIRFDHELNEYVTTDGDRYPKGDIEETVRHIMKREAVA